MLRVRIHVEIIFFAFSAFAFSALTLLVGHQESIQLVKNWVMRCRSDVQTGNDNVFISDLWPVRPNRQYRTKNIAAAQSAHAHSCTWSSWCHCVPKPHHLLPHLNPDWFYISGTGLPRLSWKRGHLTCVCVCVIVCVCNFCYSFF